MGLIKEITRRKRRARIEGHRRIVEGGRMNRVRDAALGTHICVPNNSYCQHNLRVYFFRRAMLIKRTCQIGSNCISVAVLNSEARNEMHELAVFEQRNRR